MIRVRRVVLAGMLLGAPARAQEPSPDIDYSRAFDAVRAMAPRSDRVAAVSHLVLRRDVIAFTLEQGRLYLLTPVATRTVGAVFVGTGSVSFVPPLAVERAQLRHLLGDSSLDTPITAAVLWFTDSTLAELERGGLTFGTQPVASAATEGVGTAFDRMTDARVRAASPTFMAGVLNGEVNGYFAAFVKRSRGEDLVFSVDPGQAEEVQLLRRGREGEKVQQVCHFPRLETLRDSLVPTDQDRLPLALDTIQLETALDNGFGFSASATVHFTARRARQRWVPLALYSELTVDSVVEAGGTRDSFFRPDQSAGLWIRLASPPAPGEARVVRIVYHGPLIQHGSIADLMLAGEGPRRLQVGAALNDMWTFIKSTEFWYPRYGGAWSTANMVLTFHTPKRYQFSSIGRLVDSRIDGDVRTTVWVTERPEFHASFNIGDFKEFKITDSRIPPVTVHVNAEAHRHLNAVMLQPRDPEQLVGTDISSSLAFFSSVFGPPLFPQYYATEIPYGHGQAFPGLIHLSWFTFQSVDETGSDQLFRAHEMAHQWWGIGVTPAGYRDAWISEGFAEFAGLWYMQRGLGDNKKFFKQLGTWRDEIRRRRHDAPPLGLGDRSGTLDPDDYQLMVYEKGAWVLQMLRNMMIDLRTMNEAAFMETMQDFYRTYRGRRASTRDFQRVVERHVGRSMNWFFDEWVDGTDIPTYVVSWTGDSSPDHQYVLRLRVRQEEVPPDFVMPVPVLIEFADRTQAIVRIPVRGAVTDKELRVPMLPTRVELNPLQSVLAEVKEESWH